MLIHNSQRLQILKEVTEYDCGHRKLSSHSDWSVGLWRAGESQVFRIAIYFRKDVVDICSWIRVKLRLFERLAAELSQYKVNFIKANISVMGLRGSLMF